MNPGLSILFHSVGNMGHLYQTPAPETHLVPQNKRRGRGRRFSTAHGGNGHPDGFRDELELQFSVKTEKQECDNERGQGGDDSEVSVRINRLCLKEEQMTSLHTD